MPKFSIIVPVYNVEAYLRRCVDSILAQTFTDFELLLIDDGSPDECGAICDEYAIKDNRIRVFHKKNGGASSARNLGVDNARGEWLLFIDSDDEIIENSLCTLLEYTADADLITTAPIYVYNGNPAKPSTLDSHTFNPEQYAYCVLRGYHGQYQGYVCTKAFKRSIIIDNNLRFDEDIAYNEDRLFVMRYICLCSKVLFLDYQFDLYHLRDDSAMGMNNKIISQKSITELYAFQRIIDCIRQSNFMDKNWLIRHANYAILLSSDILLSKCTSHDISKEIKKIKSSVPFGYRLWYYGLGLIKRLIHIIHATH